MDSLEFQKELRALPETLLHGPDETLATTWNRIMPMPPLLAHRSQHSGLFTEELRELKRVKRAPVEKDKG